LACIYFLAGISTFLTGLAAFFEKSVESSLGVSGSSSSSSTDGKNSDELKIDPFTIVLPIIVFIFDIDMRRVYRKREKYLFLLLKLVFWAFFYLILGFAGSKNLSLGTIATHQDLHKFINFMFLVWPCVGAVYSYCLTRISYMTIQVQGPGLFNSSIFNGGVSLDAASKLMIAA
jgi:hypothetical protein